MNVKSVKYAYNQNKAIVVFFAVTAQSNAHPFKPEKNVANPL